VAFEERDNVLVISSSHRRSNKRTNPEYPLQCTDTHFNPYEDKKSKKNIILFLRSRPKVFYGRKSQLLSKLLAGLMPVPVMGMVAKCNKNTANPTASGARTCITHVKIGFWKKRKKFKNSV
jgi:hypothetical protein